MISGGGSTTLSSGAIGNDVEMERKTWSDCLNVSESGTSRLNCMERDCQIGVRRRVVVELSCNSDKVLEY